MSELNNKLMQTPDLNKERLETLKSLFPDLFTVEGKLNPDELKKIIDPELVKETERFEFKWFGKSEAKRNAFTPSKATLVYDVERSVNPEFANGNIIIEGENLETLKCLLSAYREKVKCIYIDPPYNTGNDFVYSDKWSIDKESYWEHIGVTENGVVIDSNREENGKYHSNWLDMLYPRLLLGRQLLANDGAIFISIDDNEVHNLRKLCDEVFGEDNYINTVSVKAKPSAGASGGGEDKRLKKNTEYVMIYVKDKEYDSLNLEQAYEEIKLTDHIKSMREDNKSWKYTRILMDAGTKNQIKIIKDGDGNDIKIFTHTNYSMKSISEIMNLEEISEEEVYKKYFDLVFRDTNAQSSIRTRVMDAIGKDDGLFSIEYIPRSGRNKGKITTVFYKGTKKDQIAWLKDIAVSDDEDVIIRAKTGTLWLDFNWNNVSKEGDISFPNGKKPILFIQRMLGIATSDENKDLVLDFFSGSGSTGHAVIDINMKDNGNRRVILVQLPEIIDKKDDLFKAGFKKISDITIERNKRVIHKLEKEEAEKQPSLLDGDKKPFKTGFKVYKLAKSNFPRVDFAPDPTKTEEENLALLDKYIEEKEAMFLAMIDEKTIFDEVLLKNGFKLNYSKEKEETFSKNAVYKIKDDFKECLICMDMAIQKETLKELEDFKDKIFICLERGLDTTMKWNLKHLLGDKLIAF